MIHKNFIHQLKMFAKVTTVIFGILTVILVVVNINIWMHFYTSKEVFENIPLIAKKLLILYLLGVVLCCTISIFCLQLQKEITLFIKEDSMLRLPILVNKINRIFLIDLFVIVFILILIALMLDHSNFQNSIHQ